MGQGVEMVSSVLGCVLALILLLLVPLALDKPRVGGVIEDSRNGGRFEQ